jgi:hypothetical protein
VKPWPKPPFISKDATRLTLQGAMAHCGAMIDYERARADCAMERLVKLRKAAIRFMASDIAKKHADYGCVDAIAEALKDIGELPE